MTQHPKNPQPARQTRQWKMEGGNKNLVTAAKGGSITFAGKIFEQGLSFLFVLIVARVLGADSFGQYRLSVVIITILSLASLIGLDSGVKRFIPLSRKDGDEPMLHGVLQLAFFVPGIIGFLVTGALFFGAEEISRLIFNKPDLANILRIIALALPFLVFRESASAVVIGFKQIKYEIYSRNFLFNSLKLLLSIGAIVAGWGILGVIWAFIISAAVSTVLLIYFVNKVYPLRRTLQNAKRPTRSIINFSLPLFMSTLLNQFGRRFETMLLGIFGIFADVGIYSAMLSISNIGANGYGALRRTSTPIFAELHSQGRFEELKQFYQTTTKWALAFNLPFFLTILLFSENLLVIFGEEFTAGSLGLILLALGSLFSASTGACGTLISMAGYSKVSMYNSILYLGATLVLDFLLIPQYKILGAALAGALTIVIINTVRLFQVYAWVHKLLPFNRTFWKPLTASLLAAITVYLLRPFVFPNHALIQFISLVIALWVIYIGALLAFRLSTEDQMIVDKFFRRWKKMFRKGKKRDKKNIHNEGDAHK